jgi:hypothetical protein
MKLLFVGDPHAEVADLEDCAGLAHYILTVAEEQNAMVVMAGDLYHTHAIIHAEVQYFWYLFFDTLQRRSVDCIVLKGNHDAPGTIGSRATALIAHIGQCTTVLHKPLQAKGVLFCPYTTGEQLVKWSHEYPATKTLFCHQTFNGSVYENGFYAGDGVDPADILQEQVVSGHIHAPQEFGKVWYPGAPRWRTLSDANVDRALWLIETDDATGRIVKRTAFPTDIVCRRIYHLEDTPTSPLHVTPDPRHDYRIDSKGPAAWLETRKPVFEGWARWRGIKTDSKAAVRVRESEGVGVAFRKWMKAFQPKHGTPHETLKTMVKERIHDFAG